MSGWFRPVKYLDPKNKTGFYKLFGEEENKDLLMHFLNALFFSKIPITNIETLSPIKAFKPSVVDVLCIDQNGTKYIIQLEPIKEDCFLDQFAQEYAFKAYGKPENLEGKYSTVQEIIYIAIANYTIFPNSSCYKWEGIKKPKCALQNFSFSFIELPKFQKNKEELSSMEEKWCYFFQHAYEATKEDVEKLTGKDRIFHRAYTTLDPCHWTENELESYDTSTRIDMDNKAVLDYKKEEANKARIKARIEEKMEIAKNLFQNGIGIDIIAECADLSPEQIEEVKKYTLNVPPAVNF